MTDTTATTDTNAVVAVYDKHSDAEEAIEELKKAGFDVTRLSVIGKDYHTEEHVVGYYNAGDRIILGARRRPVADRGTRGRLDHRRFGRSRGLGRAECPRRRALQRGHTQGQCHEI
jgi:hypothetical protein